jgi:DinB superfamily
VALTALNHVQIGADVSESTHLADLVTRVMTGDPWHGPNVEVLIHDLTPEEALHHPVPGGHSIWELVKHMTGWAREVQARLEGGEAGEPAAGDWPPLPSPPNAAAWAHDRRALFAAHESLALAIRRTTPEMLDTPVVDLSVTAPPEPACRST